LQAEGRVPSIIYYFTNMVKIRLARRGRKRLAIYDIVVAHSRSPRDGKFIEKIGTFNPNAAPEGIVLDVERALYWIMVGAQPTDTTRRILSVEGVMFKKHLQVGVNKGAITQEQADAKFNAWKNEKAAKNQKITDTNTAKKAQAKKDSLAAETKKKEAKAEAVKKKQEVKVVETPQNNEAAEA
jgi:small subunit ribosomal protein S16